MKNPIASIRQTVLAATLAPTLLAHATRLATLNWRGAAATTGLALALSVAHAPVSAAEVADINLNLVGAEVETVIKTIGSQNLKY
ncbi:MAG: hypothetical protein HYZ45_13790 [Burkholderiales bacterium]|nr:hypothetical protein [Burkholderiales bacterium]